jgi:hypothetical protein
MARAVERENVAAAATALQPTDARWVFAARVHESLDGEVLPPERRSRLERLARLLGLRPFDAQLIVAIVQDQARRRAPLSDAAPLVAMIPAQPRPAGAGPWRRWLVALLLAAFADAAIIAWIILG